MFPVERRALGVIAALGVALLPVVVADRLSNSADSSEPGADYVTGMPSSRYVFPSPAASPRFKALETMNFPNGDVGRFPAAINPNEAAARDRQRSSAVLPANPVSPTSAFQVREPTHFKESHESEGPIRAHRP